MPRNSRRRGVAHVRFADQAKERQTRHSLVRIGTLAKLARRIIPRNAFLPNLFLRNVPL